MIGCQPVGVIRGCCGVLSAWRGQPPWVSSSIAGYIASDCFGAVDTWLVVDVASDWCRLGLW